MGSRSTTTKWRFTLFFADVCLAVALVVPGSILRACIAAAAFILSIVRRILPAPILDVLNRLPSPLSSDADAPADADLRDSHAPAITIRRHFVPVGDELLATELLTIDPVPSSAASDVHFVLISGNPGSCHYYGAFLSHLHALSGHALHIHCLSFAGHQSAEQLHLRRPPRLYDLRDQTAMWRSYLRQLVQRRPNARVIVAGHSIGAWIALQCAAVLPSANLLHFFLLFPTLSDMSNTPNGRRLWRLFAYGQTLSAMLAWGLSAFLPISFLLSLVLRFLPPSSPTSTQLTLQERRAIAQTTADLLHPSSVRQVLHLAHSELQTVRDMDPRLMAPLREGRATLITAVGDGWNPLWQQDRLRLLFPQARMRRMEKGITHAFVVEGSRRVAEDVWVSMQKLKLNINGDTVKDEHSAATARRREPLLGVV